MKQTKLFTLLTLVILATFVFVPTAYAFDGRGGEKIVIAQDEVIDEDLYLGATEVIVEGTINGDLMAAGQTVIINGTVTGDLFVAGQSVTINGVVGDDVFAAAQAVTLGPSADIADDVFSAGASVETRAGSKIGGQLMIGAAQGLVAGDIAEDLYSGTNSLRLEGTVGGDAQISVDSADSGFSPAYYFGPESAPMPSVPAGLSFGPDAKVNGAIEYISPKAVTIGSEIAAKVTHSLPPMDEEISREIAQHNTASSWIFDQLRRIVALLFIGLLLAWLAPRWITRPAEMLQSRPLPSLGVGFVGLVASPVVFFTALGLIIVFAVIFGALSLFNLTGLTLLTGFPLLGLAFVAFLVIVSYLCQSILAYVAGSWILNKVRPEWNSKLIWPLLLGLVIFALLFAIPIAGGLLQFIVVLAGLGAILLLTFQGRQAPQPAPVVAETL